MPRFRKKKITPTEECINELLQELYNDNHNYKANIKQIFSLWGDKVKEPTELAVLGKNLIDLLTLELKNQDLKHEIVKTLKTIVYKNDPKKADVGKGSLSTVDKSNLLEMVKQDREKNKQQQK